MNKNQINCTNLCEGFKDLIHPDIHPDIIKFMSNGVYRINNGTIEAIGTNLLLEKENIYYDMEEDGEDEYWIFFNKKNDFLYSILHGEIHKYLPLTKEEVVLLNVVHTVLKRKHYETLKEQARINF